MFANVHCKRHPERVEGRRGAGIRGWTHRLAEPGYVISILSKGNQAKRLINPNLFSQLAFRVP